MSPSNQNQNELTSEGGCKICGRDDNQLYILLCESCNEEYHIYCLFPPIRGIPEGDFYCPNCQKSKQQRLDSFYEYCDEYDTLDEQVAALPHSFTSRFGEIIWAAGGNGFGWWPAYIYDPRHTVGAARKLALENIGKKHLVYFFGCTDHAPFTVLPESKYMNWDIGLTSASAGKPKSKKAKNDDDVVSQSPKRNSRDEDKGKDKETSPGSNNNSDTYPSPSLAVIPVRRSNRNRKPSRSLGSSNHSMVKKNRNLVLKSCKCTGTTGSSPSNSPSASPPRSLSTSTQRNLFCVILRNDSIPTSMAGNDDFMQLVKQPASTQSIGFIKIPNRSCTFADARDIMVRDLDQDEDCLPSKFKFFVPNLGPMSIKQEHTFGPMLDFLVGADPDGDMSEDEIKRVAGQFGDGSKQNPLKVMVYKFGL